MKTLIIGQVTEDYLSVLSRVEFEQIKQSKQAIRSARTWQQLEAQLKPLNPEQFEMICERFLEDDYHTLSAEASFDGDALDDGSGDLYGWPPSRTLYHVPADILAQYGEVCLPIHDDQFWVIPLKNSSAFMHAMQARGYSLERDDRAMAELVLG